MVPCGQSDPGDMPKRSQLTVGVDTPFKQLQNKNKYINTSITPQPPHPSHGQAVLTMALPDNVALEWPSRTVNSEKLQSLKKLGPSREKKKQI